MNIQKGYEFDLNTRFEILPIQKVYEFKLNSGFKNMKKIQNLYSAHDESGHVFPRDVCMRVLPVSRINGGKLSC